MLSSFRRLSKSKVGSFIMVLFVLAILASFALGDIQNTLSGNFGLSSDTLAKVGSQKITDRDMSQAMERRLAEVRQQNPLADYAALSGDFEPLLASLVDQRTLQAFADKYGFSLSKRLVDAEIAAIPSARGLNGKFSEQAYQAFLQQQRMTDAQVRDIISAGLLQRLILTPAASNTRVPVGVATPYASMLLEARQGEVALIPIAAFAGGLNPTEQQLHAFYAANRARYMIPEQRVLRYARIGPEQVAGVTATDQDIAAYYKANQAQYAAKETRSLSQAVVPDKATADAIAARAKGGAGFAAAAAPAGLSANDIAVGAQTRQQFASLAGDKVATAAFGAAPGAIVGPIQSDLGWHVVKVDSVRREGGKSLAAARSEIAAKVTDEKRKNALTDLITTLEDEIANGANLTEAAAKAKLKLTDTPPITAAGTSRTDPGYKFPAELAPALTSGFELAADDEPVVETLPGDAGYVVVAPAQIIASAPAPIATVRDRLRNDWIAQQAGNRARAAAAAIAAKVARGVPLAQAVREAGASLPPVQQVGARRIDLTELAAKGQVPPPLQMLFSLGQGKSRMLADTRGRGFYVVKLNTIVPGNALAQPGLIASVQNEFQQALSQEYAQQFLSAVKAEVGVKRNESAIAAARKRITSGS